MKASWKSFSPVQKGLYVFVVGGSLYGIALMGSSLLGTHIRTEKANETISAYTEAGYSMTVGDKVITQAPTNIDDYDIAINDDTKEIVLIQN